MNKVEMLAGQKIALFDAEIKESIENLPNGWKDHDKMGVSVLVLFDYETMRYRIFGDNNIDEALNILFNHDLVVGFNTVNFDWKLLKATYIAECAQRSIKRKSEDFDILREIWTNLGLDPDNFNGRTHGGFKLDDVAFETIGLRKTGDGAQAPILYQQGKLYDVIDYCIEDVRIERTLFEYIVENEFVVRHGRPIKVPFHFKDQFLKKEEVPA